MSDDGRFRVNPGHRGPRTPRRPRQEVKTTIEAFNRIRDHLLLVGDASWEDVRREIAGISRQRIRLLRDLMVAERAIIVKSSNGADYISEGDRLSEVDPAYMVKSISIELRKSSISRGSVQVFCSLCGLQGKTWKDPNDARRWFHEKHIKTSVAHALS